MFFRIVKIFADLAALETAGARREPAMAALKMVTMGTRAAKLSPASGVTKSCLQQIAGCFIFSVSLNIFIVNKLEILREIERQVSRRNVIKVGTKGLHPASNYRVMITAR